MIDLRYKASQYSFLLKWAVFYVALGVGAILLGAHSILWLLLTIAVYVALAVIHEAGYHRLFCHESYDTTPEWKFYLLIGGALSCLGSTLQWVPLHDEHHAHSDTLRDPYKLNKWTDMFKTVYKIERVSMANKRVVMSTLGTDPAHRWVHRHYWAIPLGMMLLLFLIGGNALVFFGYLLPVSLGLLSAAFFNHLAHDEFGPIDNAWFAWHPSGEWLHDIHHRFPHLWRLGEYDMTGHFIKLIRK